MKESFIALFYGGSLLEHSREREYKFDNIRCFMIFLVIFGHLLEGIPSAVGQDIYRVIYSFHIPVLIFISGYFSEFNRYKIASSLMYPYVVFQALYTIFNSVLNHVQMDLQFTIPLWILWYLLVLIFYNLLIPFIDSRNFAARIFVLAGSVGISLLSGYYTDIGYYMTMSRFFTFAPYFIAGYYLGHPVGRQVTPVTKYFSKGGMKLFLLFLVSIFACYVKLNTGFSKYVLYGAYSYLDGVYSSGIKLMLMVISSVWIIFFLVVTPNVKIPVLSAAGGNTLAVFLLHGFVVRILQKYKVFLFGSPVNLLLAAGISLGILLLFGNSYFAVLFKKIFTGWWLEEIGKKLPPTFMVKKSTEKSNESENLNVYK